jgi:hypothetical protein
MGDKLKEAFGRASKLAEDEQDAFAPFLLAELADESHWQEQYARSTDALTALANEARREFDAGETRADRRPARLKSVTTKRFRK